MLGSQQNKGLIGNAIGSILKTRTKGLESYVHQSPFKHLDVIPASPSLGTLAHALESKHKIYKLRDALQQLTGQYERVFIDTPKPNSIIKDVNLSPSINTIPDFFADSIASLLKLEVVINTPFLAT